MLKTVGNPSTRTGDQTIIDGNLVIGTAGKGINFSADPSSPGMTSELLDDYEEGTFTPAIVWGGLTPTLGTCNYVKVGNVVTATFDVTWPGNADGNDAGIYLPFSSKTNLIGNGFVGFANYGTAVNIMSQAGSNAFYLTNSTTGTRITNAQFSGKRIVGTAAFITN